MLKSSTPSIPFGHQLSWQHTVLSITANLIQILSSKVEQLLKGEITLRAAPAETRILGLVNVIAKAVPFFFGHSQPCSDCSEFLCRLS